MSEDIDGDFITTKAGASPVISKTIQPWKDPNITHEDLLHDLMGCILSFWGKYRSITNASYSQEEAISDGYHGILECIEKDKKAPTCAGSIIKCKHCEEKFQAPKEMPGDDRANKIYHDFPADRVPKKRNISVKCTNCGKITEKTVYKTVFSTCVFYYIRSHIQKGISRSIGKKGTISIDGDQNNENSLINFLTSKEKEDRETIPSSITDLIDEILDNLPKRQSVVLALTHGIGGVCNDIIPRSVTCPHCERQHQENKSNQKPQKIDVEVDYGVSKNYHVCPVCNQEFEIDMSMNQTDIAKHLNVSKQRICSSLKSIISKLRGEVSEQDNDYCKWKNIYSRLLNLVSDHGVI